MKLFLPCLGWHVRFKQAVEEYSGKVFKLIEQGNSNIIEEPEEEAIFMGDFDVNLLVKEGVTEWVKPVYYWTTEDPVDLPENTQGIEVEVCMGTSVIYEDLETALADLAEVHEPVALLRELSTSGSPTAQPLARAILDGDRETLGILADALEEEDHPQAGEIRALAKAEGKPKKGKKKPPVIVPSQPPPPKVAEVKPALQLKSGGGGYNGDFLPPGSRVVLLGYDTLEARDTSSGKVVWEAMLPTSESRILAVSPDGQRVAVGTTDGEWINFDAANGTELSGRTARDPIRGLAYSPGGEWIAAVCERGTLGIWQAATGANLVLGHAGEGLVGVTWYSEDQLLIAGPGGPRFVDIRHTELLGQRLNLPGVPTAFAVNTGRTLTAVALDDHQLVMLALPSGAERWRVTLPAALVDLTFSPDGTLLVGADALGNISLLDAAGGTTRNRRGLQRGEGEGAIARFSPSGKQLLTTAREDDSSRLWNVSDLLPPPVSVPLPAQPVAPVQGRKAVAAPTTQEIVLLGGYPASGKSTHAQSFLERGYERLNRDESGGTLEQLLRPLGELLSSGKSVILDNLYPNRESRAPFVRLAQERSLPIRFLRMDTSLEDAQFNASLRMMEKVGRLLMPDEHKQAPYKKDPSLFPVFVIYKYRKDYEAPTTAEGFSAVETIPFQRRIPADWTNKAVFFDMDGTLRTNTGSEKYPTKIAEVKAFTERGEKLRELKEAGYLLLGVSNQSGIARGKLTSSAAEACFAETARQLGVTFEAMLYCPHSVPPLSCFCRKPNPGLGVQLLFTYKLDPRQCQMVGDLGTDRSFAERLGITFVPEAEYFA